MFVPQAARVPNGREVIFSEVDVLVLLEGKDGDSEAQWRDALRPYNLENRLAAVLVSSDPQEVPTLSIRRDGKILRGHVTGLDRSRKANDLGRAFKAGLADLWPALLEAAKEGGIHG